MGDQRQMFRFRLPWLSAAAAPRPAAQPQPRPAAQTQAPAQPTTTIPIQRPPFRPAGIAPVQTPPTQGQAPPQKTEPQPAATSRAATESKATLRPASPPRLTTQIRAASVPPSPSRRATETQVTSQPVAPYPGSIQTQATSQTRSPTRAPTQARAASVPPSPSRIASQPQSTAQTVSKQQSPSRLASQPPGQTSSQPSSPSRRATQERSQPPSSTLPPSSVSQVTTFRPFGVAVEPSQASAQVKEVAPIPTATETPSAPLKPKEREERKKAAEERRKAKTKGSTHEEPEQRTITKLLAAAADAGTKTRELLGAAFETGIRHQEKQEDIERKKTWTTSGTGEKQIKTVSSTYPKEGSMPNNSHQKHATSTWEQVPLHKEIREDISKFVHKMATGQPKLPTDEKSISVLTLAGENRGASFYMGSESAKKDGLVHIHRGYKINPDDSPDATTTDGEGSSRGRKPKDSMTRQNPAPRAYVNSNTQSINNSVVFESSVNERNPGVHLEFLQNSAKPTKSNAKAERLETRKAEFNITPAEKLTYEPTVRRRCLRGLFAEPSDSDPDNPEKPRRHGCRYSCGEMNKEKEIGIL
ncbi:proteoglycan 4 [Herrania umbratica]|uniref:Proteoglycan 4 n=1 Tax=Herrania umbratica TaxID=108875 RepID=A0A6J1AAS5_9ROSI|nr:proteoglycan 4 [Herrania umbratica]